LPYCALIKIIVDIAPDFESRIDVEGSEPCGRKLMLQLNLED
jgi:hypothetical protein